MVIVAALALPVVHETAVVEEQEELTALVAAVVMIVIVVLGVHAADHEVEVVIITIVGVGRVGAALDRMIGIDVVEVLGRGAGVVVETVAETEIVIVTAIVIIVIGMGLHMDPHLINIEAATTVTMDLHLASLAMADPLLLDPMVASPVTTSPLHMLGGEDVPLAVMMVPLA